MLISKKEQAKFKRGNYYSLFGLVCIVNVLVLEYKFNVPFPSWLDTFSIIYAFIFAGYLVLYQFLLYLLEDME